MMHDLVVVARFSYLQEAENARAVLAGERIPSILADESVLRSDWVIPESSGGIRLQVRECDAERAQEILTTVADGFDLGEIATIDAEPEAPPPPATCARCGSSDFHSIPRLLIFLMVAVVLSGMVAIGGRDLWPVIMLALLASLIIFVFVDRWRCRDCGMRWS